ncbi:hypothetical protein AB836_00020 [Rickettsiales bacterium (ex Bugula neritina AB1)]|nr:hypothetical protein AB836_00020 [Rickettsiales bacterium (ex Bugula neritina AB1)]
MITQEEYNLLFNIPNNYKFYKTTDLNSLKSNTNYIPIILCQVIKSDISNNYKVITLKDVNSNKIFKGYFHKKMRIFLKSNINYSFAGIIYNNNGYFCMLYPKYYLGEIKSFVVIKYKGVENLKLHQEKIRDILFKLPNAGYIKNVNLSLKESLLKVHVLKKFSFLEIQEAINVLKLYEYTCFWHKFKNINFLEGISKETLCSFKFSLTNCQKNVLKDLVEDLKSPKRKIRFLQGDVGTGKTLVAFLGIMKTLLSGFNAVFMAPTTILARQHFKNFQEMFPNLRCDLIIGGYKNQNYNYSEKNTVFFGTHALINDKHIDNIGYLIIDEQHKFGLLQRKKLLDKYPKSDLLLLSATPIPRSLYLIKNGYINLSVLKTKPFKSQRTTKIIKKIEEILDFVKKVSSDEKILWITSSIKNYKNKIGVIERYYYFKELGIDSTYIHGDMKDEEKFQIIDNFHKGILVSTICVETGIDIKNLNYIVIEDAENFGLSTIHQLRGRVGRHGNDSICFLINNKDNERINFFSKTECGWKIAEEDLKIRGSGNIFKEQQWGFQQFKFGEIEEDLFNKAKSIIYNKTYNKNKINELSNYFFQIDDYFC